MTDIIDFLESVGQDAQLRYASQDKVERALISAEIAPSLQTAILTKNRTQLEKLLGQVPLCAPFMPGNEEQDEGDEDEKNPSREPDEAPEPSLLRVTISAG